MTATVTGRYFGHTLRGPGGPGVLVKESAMLPCGCGCHVGVRIDTGETATGAHACSPAHDGLIGHFQLLLRESLVQPTGAPLVDVVRELLDQAQEYWQ